MISIDEYEARTNQLLEEALADFDSRMEANEGRLDGATSLLTGLSNKDLLETIVKPGALENSSIYEVYEILTGISVSPFDVEGGELSRAILASFVELRADAQQLSQFLLEIYQVTVGGLERNDWGLLQPPADGSTSLEGTERILAHLAAKAPSVLVDL